MIVHSFFYLVQAALIVAVCRWISATSKPIGVLVWIGVAIRLATGLGLIGIAYFDVPVLRAFRSPDGFWALAPDARLYFDLASRAALDGVTSVQSSAPSPSFVVVLSVWFWALGSTFVSAVLLNLSCYLVTCLAIVAATRRQPMQGADESLLTRVGVIVIASFTFSPLLILASTQALKDPFFVMLVVVSCVAALQTLTWMTSAQEANPRALLAAVIIVLTAIAGIAGTRAYYGVLLWVAYASAVAIAFLRVPKARRFTVAVFAVVLLGLMWNSFRVGAGPHYHSYRAVALNALGLPAAILPASVAGGSGDNAAELGTIIVTFRRGFIGSGGRTNLAEEVSSTAIDDVLQDTAVGAAAMLLPISLLQYLSIVDLGEGSRGLLMVTDLDTLFLEMTLVAALVVVVRNRMHLRQEPSGIMFMVILSIATGLLAAYIVTNFGTLFRLRMLAIVPAWLLPLAAISGRPPNGSLTSDYEGEDLRRPRDQVALAVATSRRSSDTTSTSGSPPIRATRSAPET